MRVWKRFELIHNSSLFFSSVTARKDDDAATDQAANPSSAAFVLTVCDAKFIQSTLVSSSTIIPISSPFSINKNYAKNNASGGFV